MNDLPAQNKKDEEEKKKKGFVPASGPGSGTAGQGAIGAAADASGSAGAASGSAGIASGAARAVSGPALIPQSIGAKIGAAAGGGLLGGKASFLLASAIVCAAAAGTYWMLDLPMPGMGASVFSSGSVPGGQIPGMNPQQGTASSLEMFRDTNQGFIGEEQAAPAKEDPVKDAAAEQPGAGAGPADSSAQPPETEGGDSGSGGPGGGGRLVSSGGFGGGGGGRSGGGSAVSLPAPSGPADAAAAAKGVSSAMKGSPKPVAKSGAGSKSSSAAKKGSFGQAKFASAKSGSAARSTYETAKSQAGEAFGGQAGAGGIGTPNGGAGLSGGVSDGGVLRASDPSVNKSQYTPPEVPKPEDITPWKKYRDMMMYAILAWAALLMIAKAMAKSAVPWVKGLAKIVALLAAAAAAVVIYAGWKLVSEFDQKLMGYGAMCLGALMAFMALKAALGEGGESKDPGTEVVNKSQDSMPNQLLQDQMGKLLDADKEKDEE